MSTPDFSSLEPEMVFFYEGQRLRQIVESFPEGQEDIRDAFLVAYTHALFPGDTGPMGLMDTIDAMASLTQLVYGRLAEVAA